MEQKPKVMNTGNMIAASELAKQRVKSWIDLANKVVNDIQAKDRLSAQLCKACFYSSRFGGAAITLRKCMCCGVDQTYGSTDTDVLCKTCAADNKLCKHCGGDIEMKARRRVWPKLYSNNESQG